MENKELDEQAIIIDNVVNDKLTDKELAEIKNDESNTEWDELPTPPEPVDEQPKPATISDLNLAKGTLKSCNNLVESVKNDRCKDVIEKTAKVISAFNDIVLKGTTKKFKDVPTLTVDKHTMVSKELKFTDHLNTKYDVIENHTQYLDECETFADIARRGFDPNVNKEAPVYGVAKRMEPKNVTIARMKRDIDLATSELSKRQQAYNDYIADLEAQAKQANEPQPTNELKGDPK